MKPIKEEAVDHKSSVSHSLEDSPDVIRDKKKNL
jgi:hypothetical protein